MKVNGKVLDSMRIVKVYLPIANNDAVEFQFRPLRNDEVFEKIMPRPLPPKVMKPGGVEYFDVDNKRYKDQIASWAGFKTDWEFLKSVSQTTGLEWETVEMDKPDTWKNWRDELAKAFPAGHINLIFQGFVDAQYINEEMMEKARKLFFQRTLESPDTASDHSQKEEPKVTQSGEPVKG